MLKFVLRWVVGAVGLWLAFKIVPGIVVRDFETLLLAALLLGLVNAVVRPVLIVLTLPLTLMTLGLFLVVVNAAMIGLVGLFLPGFEVHGFWPAVWAAVVTGLVSGVASGFINGRGKGSAARIRVKVERRGGRGAADR